MVYKEYIDFEVKKYLSKIKELNKKFLSTTAHRTAFARENIGLHRDLYERYLSTIRAFSSALGAEVPYSAGHSDAVAKWAVAIAKRLNLSSHEIESIEASALLHDIGKVGICEDILKKSGELNFYEWDKVKKHPEYAIEILCGIKFPWEIKPIIYAHHERYDGSGYPIGLKGKEIPLGARIIAAADIYDAMVSHRTYRVKLNKGLVIKELKKMAGIQLDPQVVDVFIGILMSV